jgi:quercetin dioxygenase-like cupin family protein
MLTLHSGAARATAAFLTALVISLGAASAQQATAADKPAMTQAPKKLTYSRLYTSADGNSHFADEELPLALSGSPGAEGSLAVNRLGDVKGAMVASLPAGATEDWHVAPRRQFMFCLRGIVEVTAGDGTKRRVKPGEFLLLEDLTGKGHVTHSAGTEDHVALAIPVPDGVPAKK